MRLDTVSVSFVIGFIIFAATGSALAYFLFVPVFTILLELLLANGEGSSHRDVKQSETF